MAECWFYLQASAPWTAVLMTLVPQPRDGLLDIVGSELPASETHPKLRFGQFAAREHLQAEDVGPLDVVVHPSSVSRRRGSAAETRRRRDGPTSGVSASPCLRGGVERPRLLRSRPGHAGRLERQAPSRRLQRLSGECHDRLSLYRASCLWTAAR